MSAVEFALVAPLLFLLVAGVIEFGWAFHQMMDVRHGAREGARLVAVNYRQNATSTGATQTGELVNAACGRMDATSEVTVALDVKTTAAVGGTTEVVVSRPLRPLTGMLDFVLAGKTLTSSVETRQEQIVTFADTGAGGQACP